MAKTIKMQDALIFHSQYNADWLKEFGASVFHMVVRWHKLGKVENTYTLHNNYIFLAIFLPKIIEVGENLTKLWEEQFWLFIETRCITPGSKSTVNNNSITHQSQSSHGRP